MIIKIVLETQLPPCGGCCAEHLFDIVKISFGALHSHTYLSISVLKSQPLSVILSSFFSI